MRAKARAILLWCRRPRVLPVLAGPVLGAVTGGVIFFILNQAGPAQSILAFALGGLVIGMALSLLQRRSAGLVLQDVTISIPNLSTLTFAVNDEHRRVAWQLFVETASRVTTQPLPAEAGFLKEALDSLYSLFGTVRDVLKRMDPSRAGEHASVELYALKMLNEELRPFLAKWHPLLTRFERDSELGEEAWPEAEQCREELEAVRRRLLRYSRAFGKLAGVKKLDSFFQEDGP